MKNIEVFPIFQRAFHRMSIILFKPFDIAKWFFLGFSAWLGMMFSGQNGGNFNFKYSYKLDASDETANINIPAEINDTLRKLFTSEGTFVERICNFFGINESLFWTIVYGGIFVIAIIAIIYVVMLWISSRFKFIFIENLAQNHTEISEPWYKYKNLGNSAFLWQLSYTGISLLFFVISFIIGMSLIYPIIVQAVRSSDFSFSATSFAYALLFSGVFVIFVIIFALVFYFFQQFVIPIMYKKHIGAMAAYKDFLELLKNNFLTFFLFFLLQIVAGLACYFAVALLVVCTCCIAIFPLAIPYISSVLLLPISVFMRLQSMELMYALGPEYSPYPAPPVHPSVPPPVS